MKNKNFLVLSVLATAFVLAGCTDDSNRTYSWSEDDQISMNSLIGTVLPDFAKPNSVSRLDGKHFSASVRVSAAEGRNEVAAYGKRLVSAGYSKVTERSNEFLSLNDTVAAVTDVYLLDSSKGSSKPVYVEVMGGDFTLTNAESFFSSTAGFGIRTFAYDNALVQQEEWARGLTYRDNRLYGEQVHGDPLTVSADGSTQVQRSLLIPVEFVDRKFSDLPGGTDTMMTYLEKGFNGNADETSWNSLKSFYSASSYGKIDVQTELIDFGIDPETGKTRRIFSYPRTIDQTIRSHITDHSGGEGGHVVFNIISEITKYLLKDVFFYDEAAYNAYMAPYDLDDNKLIDNIWFIYPYFSNPTNSRKSRNDYDGLIANLTPAELAGSFRSRYLDAADSIFWAFTHRVYTERPNGRITVPYTFAWMSWDMLFEDGYWDGDTYKEWSDSDIAAGIAKVDGRTLIHEHGHVLGMPDYYSYDKNDSPLGGLDMMDHNIGDHGGYSKMGYGWTMPRVVNYPTSTTLKPFQEDGDLIVLPGKNKWRNTVLDEYLILEFWTPTGLNEQDSTRTYRNTTAFYPTMKVPGLKVTHVDSRLGIFNYIDGSGWAFSGQYTSQILATGNTSSVHIAADNTKSRSVTFTDRNTPNNAQNHARLTNLLLPSGQQKTGTAIAVDATPGRPASGTFFTMDSNQFGSTGIFDKYYLNDGSLFGWKFSITAVSETEMAITFSYTG